MKEVPEYLINKMVNNSFGRLLVTGYHGRNEYGHILWDCRCDCGESTISTTFPLTSGSKKSCGCLRREVSRDIRLKHGLTDHRLYYIWAGIRTRCFNPNCAIYVYYGGSGVNMCDEWSSDFQSFYDWAMSNGYSDNLSIDRYPNQDGNYEPGNCRWANTHQQIQNSSIAKLTANQVREIRNDPRSSVEIANSYGICRDNVNKIKSRKTWSNID